jgi:hypothetical protein
MPEPNLIRVFMSRGKWLVDCGSYVHGYYETLREAIEAARLAARSEGRELVSEAEAPG